MILSANNRVKATNGNTYLIFNKLTLQHQSLLTYEFSIPTANMFHTATGKCRVKTYNTTNQTTQQAKKIATLGCSNRPSLCSYIELCQKATILKNNAYEWKTSHDAQQYKREAKKRGAVCGVLPTVKKPSTNTTQVSSQKPSTNTTQAGNQKPATYSSNTSSPTEALKQECTNIGYNIGTEKHADCVLQLITSKKTQPQAQLKVTYPYAQADRICDNEAAANAQSNHTPSTPRTQTYNSNCTGYGNTINCRTTGGQTYDGGLGNFANSLSARSNRRKLYRACMLRLGHEPQAPKSLLEKVFGKK
ncbi:hypothetical protein N8381_05115 [Oceanospirillaceae bacterium]|nr:hypothetical protein [Oceanospirillaceae bacterium]